MGLHGLCICETDGYFSGQWKEGMCTKADNNQPPACGSIKHRIVFPSCIIKIYLRSSSSQWFQKGLHTDSEAEQSVSKREIVSYKSSLFVSITSSLPAKTDFTNHTLKEKQIVLYTYPDVSLLCITIALETQSFACVFLIHSQLFFKNC